MSSVNRVVILPIPAYLHDAMREVTHCLTEASGLIGVINAAFSDTIKAYGQLVDAVARYANESERYRHVFEEAEAECEELARQRARGEGAGASGGIEVDRGVTAAAEEAARRPLGSGNVDALLSAGASAVEGGKKR